LATPPKNQGRKGPGRKFHHARPVADLVSQLLDPVIERRAGMTSDLIAAWDDIIGEKHARHSRPEKLDWPRRADADDPFQPATLRVACEGSHALFLSHESDLIINRINQYFGFTAVARLKVVQRPVEQAGERQRSELVPLTTDKREKIESLLASVDDDKLKSALGKMGLGVFSGGSGDKD